MQCFWHNGKNFLDRVVFKSVSSVNQCFPGDQRETAREHWRKQEMAHQIGAWFLKQWEVDSVLLEGIEFLSC